MTSKYAKKSKRNNHKKNGSKAQGRTTHSIHSVSSIGPKNQNEADILTEIYQENIRSSPLWHYFLDIYGPEKAHDALKECKVLFVPQESPDERP